MTKKTPHGIVHRVRNSWGYTQGRFWVKPTAGVTLIASAIAYFSDAKTERAVASEKAANTDQTLLAVDRRLSRMESQMDDLHKAFFPNAIRQASK